MSIFAKRRELKKEKKKGKNDWMKNDILLSVETGALFVVGNETDSARA